MRGRRCGIRGGKAEADAVGIGSVIAGGGIGVIGGSGGVGGRVSVPSLLFYIVSLRNNSPPLKYLPSPKPLLFLGRD